MFSFILRRLGLLVPTFFGITLLTFGLIRMIPGDPVEVMVGERALDPQMHAEALHRLGLDKPLYVRSVLRLCGQFAARRSGRVPGHQDRESGPSSKPCSPPRWNWRFPP
ncbi:hypothetical protein JOS77_05255 [Chromobacterium haemolyticum]|nr:hypothetical protein JOS77_05255 [Chromobacterium haemolyticum]